MLAMILWSLVFFTRPHKEERFLYPIYPLILIGASFSLNSLHMNVFSSSRLRNVWRRSLPVLVILCHAVLSSMRGVALIKSYSASIDVYRILNEPSIKFSSPWLENKEEINVCVSKEWYRFPSSFFYTRTVELG
jgi:alpha-1,2-mannosyltransferase